MGSGASYVAGQFGQGINFTTGQYVQVAPINNGVVGALYRLALDGHSSAEQFPGLAQHLLHALRPAWTGALQMAYADPAQTGGVPGIYIENWTSSNGNGDMGVYRHDSAPALTADHWHLVTATFQGGTLNLYVEGNLVANESNGDPYGRAAVMTPENEPFLIGFSGLGGANFNGSMDDFNIYNEAATAAQVQRVYSVGNPQIVVGGCLPGNLPCSLPAAQPST